MHTVKKTINGKELSLETGRFAKLSAGSVMVRYGDTMVLVAANSAAEPKPDLDFLPLTCEYREKQASSGKIPGGFFRREARPSNKEILASRLMDRPLRPLFPKDWRSEIQVIGTVYSYDLENEPDMLAVIGASAALVTSDIPFSGPVSEVRVCRVDGEFVVLPTWSQIEASDLEIIVAGSDTSIVMVEGASKEISEADFVAAMEFAHTMIREINALQRELAALVNPTKREVASTAPPEEIVSAIDVAIADRIRKQIRISSSKEERNAFRSEVKKLATDAAAAVVAADAERFAAIKVDKVVSSIVKKIEAREMREMILTDGVRLDGRKTNEIRPITVETGVLPRPHGSALFTRGETQSLTTVTLGTKKSAQLIDGLRPTYELRYMLHYNFPPFSTGETGRFGFTSRRETGHGDLAERALEPFIPNEAEFPYTIRVVSDVLESNGSSSMATVCAGSLALYHAGVPMTNAVSGIAMGLILEGDRFAVLSDILGDEDFLGDMDFKVTGTMNGITACQMDIKVEGLSVEIMRQALAQARDGRLHILGIMNAHMSKPNDDLSQYAPKLTTIMIPVEMIGAVIGPGGEMIRSICKDTNTEINIEDDGSITIAAIDQASCDAAISKIREITRPIEIDTVFTGKVKEIREGLGAFIEIRPKKEGLLHISQLDHRRVENVGDILKVGELVQVKVIEVQPDGKVRLSRKALIPLPEGMEAQEERPRSPRPPYGGGGGDRGGRGGGDRGGDRGGRGGGDRGGDRYGRGGGDRGGDRGPRGPRDERPRDDRPREDRPHDDRPRRDERPRDERPRDERPRDEQPREKPSGDGDFYVG
ncbi:MAG: polyribonucleotide nucleotidyltransferase [Ignavibacteria bacterium]|nr:polyribonucleotide nucleotidyltransferase [Ignavibacteria bacterium]